MATETDYSKMSDEELERMAAGSNQKDYSTMSEADLEKLANAPAVTKEVKPEDAPVIPPMVGGMAGASTLGTPLAETAGAIGAASIAKDLWKQYGPGTPGGQQLLQKFQQRNQPTPPPELTPAQKWNVKMHGVNLPHGEMDEASFDLGQQMKSVIAPGGELAGGEIRHGIILDPNTAEAVRQKEMETARATRDAEILQEARARMNANRRAAATPPVQETAAMGSPILNKVKSKAITMGLAYPAAFGTAYNATDAYNRAMQNNWGQAALSGAGAAGSLATMIPNKKVRALGAAAALGAPVVNAIIDTATGHAAGGKITPVVHKMEGDPKLMMQGIKAAQTVQKFADGRSVLEKGANLIKGYLAHTPQKPNELVGTRFEREMVGELAPKTDFDPMQYKGASIKIFPYDSTSRGYKVSSVAGHELTNPLITTGGQDYLRDIAHINEGIGGASNLDIAKRVLDRQKAASRAGEKAGGTGEVIMMPTTMGAGAENFSSMPTNIMLDLLNQRELPKKTIRSLDDQVRALRDPKKGAIFENFVGFGSPDLKEQMTTGGFGLGTTPGELRKAIANRLGMVENQKLLDYNLGDLTSSITDPALSGLPKGFAGNVIARGNPEGELTLASHPDYSHNYPGSYAGSGPSMPVEFWLPDAYKNIGDELRAKYPNINESNLHNSIIGALEKRKEGFSGLLNDQVIDNYGRFKEGLESGAFEPNDLWAIRQYMNPDKFADGGAVNMADGKSVSLKQRAAEIYPTAKEALTFVPKLYAPMVAGQMLSDISHGEPEKAVDTAGGLSVWQLANALKSMPVPKSGALGPLTAVAGMMTPGETASKELDEMPGRQGNSPLLGSGSVMEHYTPHMAGGGDVVKSLIKKALGSGEDIAARTIEGSPHTYPPIAEGPWMRDYQQAAEQVSAPTSVTTPGSRVVYMGKYVKPTPENIAAQNAQMQSAIQNAMDNRKAQYIAGLKNSGWSDQDIAEHVEGPHPFGPPWLPR